jgi:hypothetical protein
MTLCSDFDKMALQINDLVSRIWLHGPTNKWLCVQHLTSWHYKSITLGPDFDNIVLQINDLVSRFWQHDATNKWPCVQILPIWRYSCCTWPCVQILTRWRYKSMTLCPDFDYMPLQINDLSRFWRYGATNNWSCVQILRYGATNKWPCVLGNMVLKSMTLCPHFFDNMVLQINGPLFRYWRYGATNQWPCVQVFTRWLYK